MHAFPRKYTFKVYYSMSYTYLRIVMFLSPIICFIIATWISMNWMYLAPIVMLSASIYVFSYINASILITGNGIDLIKCVKKQHFSWAELQFVGRVEIWPLGCVTPLKVVYFSKREVNYAKLRHQQSLPQLSSDFVFLIDQPMLKETLSMYLAPTKLRRIYNPNEIQRDDFKS